MSNKDQKEDQRVYSCTNEKGDRLKEKKQGRGLGKRIDHRLFHRAVGEERGTNEQNSFRHHSDGRARAEEMSPSYR